MKPSKEAREKWLLVVRSCRCLLVTCFCVCADGLCPMMHGLQRPGMMTRTPGELLMASKPADALALFTAELQPLVPDNCTRLELLMCLDVALQADIEGSGRSSSKRQGTPCTMKRSSTLKSRHESCWIRSSLRVHLQYRSCLRLGHKLQATVASTTFPIHENPPGGQRAVWGRIAPHRPDRMSNEIQGQANLQSTGCTQHDAFT